jgi:hypothetical protein
MVHQRDNGLGEIGGQMLQENTILENGSKRAFQRKKYEPAVIFGHSDRIYRGNMKNISLGGVFIETPCANELSTHDIVIVNIPFADNTKVVKRKGRVRWQNNVGFALEFI